MSQKEKNGFFVDRRTEKPALPGLKVVHVEGSAIGCKTSAVKPDNPGALLLGDLIMQL